MEQMISRGRAQLDTALPVLFNAQRLEIIPTEKALDEALDVIQHGTQSSAAAAVNKLAVRLAAGSDRLAELVRQDQDLASEAEQLDKAIIAGLSKQAARNPAAAQYGRERLRRSPPSAPACRRGLPSRFPTTPSVQPAAAESKGGPSIAVGRRGDGSVRARQQ
jgi:hypothetical protein